MLRGLAALGSALLLLAGAGDRAAAVDAAVAAAFAELSLPVPTGGQAIICHGYNCKFRTPVMLTPADRAQLAGLMAKGRASPAAERAAAANAVAWFDRRFARIAGIDRRLARAGFVHAGERDQVDCVDSSRNTMSVLVLLAEMKLLQHHEVDAPKSRGFIALVQAPHTTAVLRETKGGRQWAVDSWTRVSGQPPEVMLLETWFKLN
jgi:hypothetical protein